jgi:hypothetical protein
MIACWNVIAQQGGRLVPIHDEDIEVTVVVEVAEGTATADVPRRNGRPGFVAQFDGGSVLPLLLSRIRILSC